MYFLIYATILLCCENEGLWLYSLHLATVTGNDDLLHWFGLQKKKKMKKKIGKVKWWGYLAVWCVLVLGLELVCFLPICLTVFKPPSPWTTTPLPPSTFISILFVSPRRVFFFSLPTINAN